MPTQVHIAYAGATPGSGMAVSWVTAGPTATTTVRYGASPSGLTTNVTGTTALDYESWVHHVVLGGLTPATTYYYTAGDAAGGWSSVTSFKTAPAAGAEFPAAVAVFGDMGIWGYSNATFADLARLGGAVDFMYLVGDGSYADDDFLHDPISPQYAATWDGWFTELQPYAATTPFMTLPGNHEAECHDLFCFTNETMRLAFANFTTYNARYRMPSAESGSTALNMWYSFDYGSIHFTQIDTETDYIGAPLDEYSSKNGGFGDQVAWVEADLAAAAAKRTAGGVTWMIASGHRPIYSRASCDADGTPSGTAAATQAAFEPLFHQYGVNIYFAGHMHSVEVQLPTYNNTVYGSFNKPPYTTYVVTGAAGCIEGHTSYNNAPLPAWSAYTNGEDIGLSMLYFASASELTWEFRRGTDGAVLYNFTLTR